MGLYYYSTKLVSSVFSVKSRHFPPYPLTNDDGQKINETN
jgi:hypothetical protein